MTPLKHTAVIDCPLHQAYALAEQVERYPEFLPGYSESRFIEQHPDGRRLLARKATVRGVSHAWRSWVRFEKDQWIDFEHAAGPLQGMKVRWLFTSLAPQKTRLTIRHDVRVARRGITGWFLEKFFFAPRVSGIAGEVIEAFKKACENGGEKS